MTKEMSKEIENGKWKDGDWKREKTTFETRNIISRDGGTNYRDGDGDNIEWKLRRIVD